MHLNLVFMVGLVHNACNFVAALAASKFKIQMHACVVAAAN